MKSSSFAFALTALLTSVPAFSAERSRAVSIGPWVVEANFTTQGKFIRCTMGRTTEEGIETLFTQNDQGLSMSMSSPRWNLQRGKKYPVNFSAGTFGWKADVLATKNSVAIDLTDQHFNEALRSADLLEVRAAGSTIKVPLDKSATALARLDSCFDKNSKALETNPFVAPKP